MPSAKALTIAPKTTGATVAGAIAYLVIRIVGHWVDLTPDDAASITLVAAAIGGYLAPPKDAP